MTQLACYKILFMTELLIAQFMFSIRLSRRKHFVLRLVGGIVLCYVVAFLFPVSAEFSYNGWYSSCMFLCLAMCALFMLMFAFRIPWGVGLFCLITAYTVQHIAYETYNLFAILFGLDGSGMYGSSIIDLANITILDCFKALVYLDVYLLVYWLSYILLGKRLVSDGQVVLKNVQTLFLSALILVVDIVLNAFIVYGSEQVKNYNLIACIYNVLCCVLVLYVQFTLVKVKESELETESLRQMLHQVKAQYAEKKENIELINLKVHDLKHQISMFARNGGMDADTVADINRMISIYDAEVKTGLEALDVVLTEKSLFCKKNGIKFSAMADCTSLQFMKESDMYVLFGNAVDNAIEAVMKISDEDKRYIGLSVYARGGLVSVNVNNYFCGEVVIGENGLPVTTKRSRDYHGFGLKSICMIVDKYKGDVSVRTENNVFNLNIVLPIPGGDE